MLLAIDTTGPFCSVAIARGERVIAEQSDEIGRGHAEHLMPMLENVLSSNAVEWTDITQIACTTGPGSFTGLRVGLATARGLALALNCPCIGVSVFECFAHEAGRPVAVALDAKRDQVWIESFDHQCLSKSDPSAVPLMEAHEHVPQGMKYLSGSAARMIKDSGRQFEILNDAASPPIASLALLAQRRDDKKYPASPLYLRAPDAKPQGPASLGAYSAVPPIVDPPL